HPADHHRTGGTERSTFRRYAVDGLEILDRVEGPDHLSASVDGAHNPIPSTSEDNSRSHARGACLSTTISHDGGLPFDPTSLDIESRESAVDLLERIVDALAIRRATPHHQTVRGRRLSFPELRFPKDLAFGVGIQGHRHSAFSGGEEIVLSADGL